MDRPFAEPPKEENKEKKQEERYYEYGGYHISVGFSGERTLKQCIKSLIDREMER